MPTTTGILTDFTELEMLDHVLMNTTWTMPTVFLGLLIATPTDTGGTEVTAAGTNGYARIALGTAGASKMTAAASRATSTNADITFGPSTGGPWTDVSYWGMYTASTAGTLLAYGDITDGVIGTDDSYKILSGNLTLSFTAGTKFTDAHCNLMLDHITGRTAMTAATQYLALYNGDPLGAGTESMVAATNGYARQVLDTALSPAAAGAITNDLAVTFGPATASWALSDYWALFAAATAGSPYAGAAVTASKTVLDTDSAEFAIGAIDFTLT